MPKSKKDENDIKKKECYKINVLFASHHVDSNSVTLSSALRFDHNVAWFCAFFR